MTEEKRLLIQGYREKVNELLSSVKKNKELKDNLLLRLSQNEDISKELRDKEISKITSEDRKELMELECKVGVLEVCM